MSPGYTLDSGRTITDAGPLAQDMTEAQADAVIAVANDYAAGAMVPTLTVTDAPNRVVTLAIARTPNGLATIDWGDGTRSNVTAGVPAGTATTTSASPNLTVVAPTTGWQNGMAVSGAGIPAGTTIVSGAGTATMVMSANATASAAGVAITGAGGAGPISHTYPANGTYVVSYTIQPAYALTPFQTPPAAQTVATEVAVNWPPPPGSMNPLAQAAFILAHPPR
jgi:hypothetical protein